MIANAGVHEHCLPVCSHPIPVRTHSHQHIPTNKFPHTLARQVTDKGPTVIVTTDNHELAVNAVHRAHSLVLALVLGERRLVCSHGQGLGFWEVSHTGFRVQGGRDL